MKFRNIMKFRNWEEKMMRNRLKNGDFYEDVSFADDFVKEYAQKVIVAWIYNIKVYEHIKVKRFKDLFAECNEMVFPIEIKHSNISGFFVDIDIVDNVGKKYYLSKDAIYSDISEYCIGKRNTTSKPFFDNEIHYRILKNGKIEKLEKKIIKIEDNGINGSSYEEYYNDENMQIIEISDSVGMTMIKIKYPILEKVRNLQNF